MVFETSILWAASPVKLRSAQPPPMSGLAKSEYFSTRSRRTPPKSRVRLVTTPVATLPRGPMYRREEPRNRATPMTKTTIPILFSHLPPITASQSAASTPIFARLGEMRSRSFAAGGVGRGIGGGRGGGAVAGGGG